VGERKELLKSRVPGGEEGFEFAWGCGSDVDVRRKVVGTAENDVVHLRALEKIADRMRLRAHPDVEHWGCGEFDEVRVFAHFGSRDEDAVGEVAGEVWG